MREFIFTITLNFSVLFFSTLAIIGKDYTGTNTYHYFSIGIAALCIIYILSERFFKKVVQIRRINILFYLLPLFTVLIYLIESPTTKNGFHYFSVYLTFSFPAIYIGTYVAANKLFKSMARWWDLVSITITLGLIASFHKIVFLRVVEVGGALSYQVVSYIAAFAFNLSLFSLLFGDRYTRFKLCQSKIFKVFTYGMLFFQIVTVFVSGGRGGFVVLFFTSSILIYLKFKRDFRFGKVIFTTITIILTLFFISNILPTKVANLMQVGDKRIFSYISPKGIDLSHTSGRNIYYSKAINLIKERPILGYGIFKYVDTSVDYPHNLFLEFLLQGGLFYLLFWIIVLWRFYLKFKRIVKADDIHLLLIPIALYPIIQLMFSGTYLMTALFWFVIAYVFNYKIPYKLESNLLI